MEYKWTCPDCTKAIGGATTGEFGVDDNIVCPWCGRVSKIVRVEHSFIVELTDKQVSPSEFEELEEMRREQKKEGG